MVDNYRSGIKLINSFVNEVWDEVDCILDEYKDMLQPVKGYALAMQALSSIKYKRFHALGGSIYALYPGADVKKITRLVVSLQTISDYLDNLCDRAGIFDEVSFRQLHLAMYEAVDPTASISDYYLYYPEKDDNGYLRSLVEACREEVSKLSSYCIVKDRVIRLVDLYSCLQVYKHLDNSIREDKLRCWAESYIGNYPDISLWEFSAATGSTLGMFILFASSMDPDLTEAEAGSIFSVYFPYISALHILLDYYIDSEEDIKEGDLNFTSYYKGREETRQRISYFIKKSVESCYKLHYPRFHLTVVRGILAMYLTDAKAFSVRNKQVTRKLIKMGGWKAVLYFHICKLLRKIGKL
jgi:Protein of unknown function (DUF2600).